MKSGRGPGIYLDRALFFAQMPEVGEVTDYAVRGFFDCISLRYEYSLWKIMSRNSVENHLS
jgi:hypothetical protein